MSTIRVDRITPYQSGSVAIEGLSISNLTIDGTITASIQEGYVLVGGSGNVSTLAPTSSFGGGGGVDITSLNSFTASQVDLNGTFANTGSNIFIGNQEITGSILMSGSQFEAKVAWPLQNSEFSLFKPETFVLEELTSGSRTYSYNAFGLEHYDDDIYDSYHNSFNFYFYSSSNFGDPKNFGSEANIGPMHTFFRMYPSGANITINENMGNISLNDLQDARTRANIYATEVHLGAFRGDILLIGNTGSLNVVRGRTEQSGSLSVSGSTTIVGDMVLTGSLTISGSSTFRNIGPTILSGSVDISGSINSDGYELAASSTETIPALNDSFYLDLSGSVGSRIEKTLVLGDGKVLVAGRFTTVDGHTTNDIARLNSDGTIDTSFSSPVFSTTIGGDAGGFINTFVTQSDGKIIVGGNFSRVNGVSRSGLARLDTNGTLDATFATQSWGSFGSVRDIVIQNDNKIVCVGSFTSGSRRVNTDGTLDTSFNVSTGNNQPGAFNNGEMYSVGLLTSGSEQAILIGGSFGSWGSYSDYTHLVKLNPNGTLDFGFGGTNLDISWTIDGYNAGDRIQKIKIGDDGYIYISGRFKDTGIGNHAGFGRVSTSDEGNGVGALDNGFRTYISGSYVNDFDFYDSDKILLGGSFTLFGNPGFSVQTANRFAIIDQNDGGLVSNWTTDTLSAKYNVGDSSVNSLALLPNNNVLLGGTFISVNSTAREGLASLKLTGFGDVTTTTDYSITADTNHLLISSSNTYFSGDITASVISGSFVGDGSGLTNLVLPSGVVSGSSQLTASLDSRYLNVSGEGTISGSFTGSFVGDGSGLTGISINTGSFATTGSNAFVGNQQITGSIVVSGSISQKGLGGGSNIVIGDDPITNLTSDAQNNTVIGADAGALLSSGSNNVFIGKMAGLLNQIGNSNVIIGTYAGYSAKDSQNVYIGESAGFSNISGRYNVAIGHQAGYNNKVDLNTFIGWQSGFQNTSGSANTFVGERSGEQNTIGQCNSFFGASAGANNSVGNYNTFIGLNAGKLNTSASFNTFVGSQAGYSTTTGGNNTFIGAECGFGNTTGYQNVFLGDNIGISVTTAYENTFIGSFSGREITAGAQNTFVGTSAGQNTRIGNDNTYIGNRAGNSNISGSNNTFVGKSAGFNITSGSDNTFFGKDAGYYTSNGTSELSGSNRSVFIGTNVKSNGHDETNQIVIGYDAVGNGSNTVTLGNNDITDTYVKGVLRASTAILAQVSSSYNFADDTAAQAGGVPLGGLYHTSGSIKIRLV